MKNKTKRMITLFCLCFLLTGCKAKQTGDKNGFGDYISITATSKNEEKGLAVSLYVYDIGGKRVKKMVTFPYTAQYSFGAVDLYDHAVCYSQSDNDKGDQIVRYDINTKKTEQLTDNLFAVNYIIPTKDKVFFAACRKGERNVCLGCYDKETKKITYWGDDRDTNIENMCVDEKEHKLYASVYSEKEDTYYLQHQDGKDGAIVPTHSVWQLDFDLQHPTKLFSLANKWIRMLLIHDSKLLAVYDDKYNHSATPSQCVYFDVKEHKREAFTLPDHRMERGDAAFSKDGKSIYLLTSLDANQDRALYQYNIEDKSYHLLFQPEGEFINNCRWIRGTK